jgi:hypothetical protein
VDALPRLEAADERQADEERDNISVAVLVRNNGGKTRQR